jgi:hypothetical protein
MGRRDKSKRKVSNLRFLLRDRTCPGKLLDKSGKTYWKPVYRPDISGYQNWTVRFSGFDRNENQDEFRKDLRT